MFSLGIIGAGQFAGSFAHPFDARPGVDRIAVTDLPAERASVLAGDLTQASVEADFDAMLASDIDAVGIFTPR